MTRTISLLASAALLTGCSQCENEIMSRVLSPSGKHEAVVFSRGCGATVNFNTQVSVLHAGNRLPDDSGNVAIFDGENSASVEWTGPHSVLVLVHGGPRTFKKAGSVGDVSVQYGDGDAR